MPAFFRHDLGVGTADDVAGLIWPPRRPPGAGFPDGARPGGGSSCNPATRPRRSPAQGHASFHGRSDARCTADEALLGRRRHRRTPDHRVRGVRGLQDAAGAPIGQNPAPHGSAPGGGKSLTQPARSVAPSRGQALRQAGPSASAGEPTAVSARRSPASCSACPWKSRCRGPNSGSWETLGWRNGPNGARIMCRLSSSPCRAWAGIGRQDRGGRFLPCGGDRRRRHGRSAARGVRGLPGSPGESLAT